VIPNVNKGGDMAGLLRYLQGPGRANEHENPHVVSGDSFLVAWHGNETLDKSGASEISAYLDEPRKLYGTEVKAQVTAQDPETGEKVVLGYRDAHVWHCSLSLSAEEGAASDEKWDEVARDFADRMGFTEASGKAPCRWVALHHGASKNGNDHVHVVASMVREDGTRWDGRFRDYKRAQDACRELEVKHGLRRVEGRLQGTAERGEKPAERIQAAKAGMDMTAPKDLAQRVRAAAVASTSESEWIRRVRGDGVIVKPFFARGTTDVVGGYRAALKPERYNAKLVFYGGGTLGRDLTLPRLREGWPEPTVEGAQHASDEWQAAFRGKAPVHGAGREKRSLASTAPDVAARNLAAFNERLGSVPIGDQVAWADAAKDVSGALSAWARYDQVNAPDLRRAAAVLSRSAQMHRKGLPPGRRVKESPMGTALLFMSARRGDKPRIAGSVLLRQVLQTAVALRDCHVATTNLRQAQAVQTEVIDRLQRLPMTGYRAAPPEVMSEADRRAWEAREIAVAGQVGPRGTTQAGPLSDPLPRPLTTRKDHAAGLRGTNREEGDRDGAR
jgi:hypothetical protein